MSVSGGGDGGDEGGREGSDGGGGEGGEEGGKILAHGQESIQEGLTKIVLAIFMIEYFYPILKLITCGKDFPQEQRPGGNQRQQVMLWFPHLVGVPHPMLKRCKAVSKKENKPGTKCFPHSK